MGSKAAAGQWPPARPAPGQGSQYEHSAALRQRFAALAAALSETRQRFAAVLAEIARTEENVARLFDELARRHPDRAERYGQAAGRARTTARRARELARSVLSAQGGRPGLAASGERHSGRAFRPYLPVISSFIV